MDDSGVCGSPFRAQTSEGFPSRPAFSPIFCFRKHRKRYFERISRRRMTAISRLFSKFSVEE
jgi:hypothetical protein